MAKNPFDRFADAGELSAQLKAYRDGRMVNIYSYSKKELFRRFLAKNKFIVVMFTLLLSVIVAGAIFSIHYAMQMEEARTKAEEALVSVTALGEQAQVQANIIAKNIDINADELFANMEKTASQLAVLPTKEQQKLLDNLHNEYPAFSSFTIESGRTIIGLSWKAIPQQLDGPIVITEKGKTILILVVPVPRQNQTIDYLVAKAAPEQVLPRLFPTEVTSSQQQDIWIMKQDGLIFYDKEEQYRGTNIFSDTLNNQSPSVVAFGRLSVSKPEGVGYYSFPDNGKTIFKIAAWQTVNFSETKNWKIVVNYSYMVRDD
jgi:serine/threonine-protein kinase